MNLASYESYKSSVLEEIDTIVDIGVSNGVFLNSSAQFFKNVKRRIGIDPIPYLDSKRWDLVEYFDFAVGEKCGQVDFYKAKDSVGSSLNPVEGDRCSVVSHRMDCFIESNDVSGNLFVKLDTQGSEIECLNSFGIYLERVSAFQIECSMKSFGGFGLNFADTIRKIDELGFYVSEIFDHLIRPKDGQLGQVDLLCLNKNRIEYQDLDWH